MRLYRAELYKLCHKKAFLICSVLTVLTMLFYFWLMVNGEMTTVNGVTYQGYNAVRMDRQITEAYRGGLTDEKVKDIVEEYGLLPEVQDIDEWWHSTNYLIEFVAEYLSDGDVVGWNGFKAPTTVYDIADTMLGEIQSLSGREIPIAYTTGWMVFFNVLEVSLLLTSALLIMSVSIVFAQEEQTGMRPLSFTTEEGKTTDVWAKIAATFTLTIIVYGVVVLSDLALCKCVFGLDGEDCPLAVAMWGQITFHPQRAASYMPVGSFAWMITGIDLLAMILLCAITLCASAYCRSTFGAVTTAASLWGIPVLVRLLCGGFGYFLTSCMPVFLIFNNSAYETVAFGRTIPTVLLGVLLSIACVAEGYRVYRRQS